METSQLLNISSFKRNTKKAFRSIIRGRFYSIINLSGLSLGLACSFLIMLYILSESGYDKCHANRDSIFRLTYFNVEAGDTDPHSSERLYEDINKIAPEIQNSILMGRKKGFVHYKNKQIEAKGIGVGIDIFEMFTIPFVSGYYNGFNDNPNNIIISESLNTKLFGLQSAVGDFVNLEIKDEIVPFIIIGVMEDLPEKSSLQADYIINFSHLPEIQKTILAEHYIQVPKEQIETVKAKVNNLLISANIPHRLIPQPLKEIHFKSGHLSNNRTPTGDLNKIVFIATIGLLILLSSIINYVILASSRTMQKSKDIAVHKVFGADRGNVISLIMTESLLLAFLSFPFAILISELFLPFAKNILRNDLVINYFNNWPYLFGMLIVTLFAGFVSGFYTAFISIKISPIEVLAKRQGHINRTLFQKGLLIFQLAIFTGLIMFTLVINNQLKYCTNYDMGFNKDNILNIHLNDKFSFDQYLTFTNEVNKVPGVKECTHGSDIPHTGGNVGVTRHFSSPEKMVPLEYIFASAGYLEMCGIELISGRFFEKERNEKENIIINESAIKYLGIVDPIGKVIDREGIIIGVVKDFVVHSLHEKIPPLIVYNSSEDRISTVLVSFDSSVNKSTLEKIRIIWDEMFPDAPFEAATFGDIYKEMYKKEVKMQKAITLFAILSVFISSLGLFGMAHFTTRQRTKEIGIRKVNGAKINDVVKLIYRESLTPYIIAILCCLPVTYLLSLKWLDNFAYSASIGILEIIISALVAFIVFSFPIILQSYQASTVNPVKSLKYE